VFRVLTCCKQINLTSGVYTLQWLLSIRDRFELRLSFPFSVELFSVWFQSSGGYWLALFSVAHCSYKARNGVVCVCVCVFIMQVDTCQLVGFLKTFFIINNSVVHCQLQRCSAVRWRIVNMVWTVCWMFHSEPCVNEFPTHGKRKFRHKTRRSIFYIRCHGLLCPW